MKYNVMIVDDVYAVDALKNLLPGFCPEINICCTVNSIAEAGLSLKTLHPEILFLNISFAGIFGLIFSAAFTQQKRIIIFTVNPDESWEKNLLANAMDFLAKPFSAESITKVLSEAIQHYELFHTISEAESIYFQSLINLRHQVENQCPVEQITIPIRFGFKIIRLSQLIYLQADVDYTILYLTESQIVVSNLEIGRFHLFLPEENFIKINTFTIIHLRFLKMRSGHEGKTLLMSDGTVLSVSKSRLTDFEEKVITSQDS